MGQFSVTFSYLTGSDLDDIQQAKAAQEKLELKGVIANLESRVTQARKKKQRESLKRSLEQLEGQLKEYDEVVTDAWIEREKKHWTSG